MPGACRIISNYFTQALLENPALPSHLKEKVLEHSDDALHKVGTIILIFSHQASDIQALPYFTALRRGINYSDTTDNFFSYA